MDKTNKIPAFAMFLFAAITIYGLFGSPTPDNPGRTEIVIGVLLILSVGAAGLQKGISFAIGRTFFLKTLQAFFLCGLILPTLAGVYFGQDKTLIVRDLLAFAFLGLPLFLSERLQFHSQTVNGLLYVMIFCGAAFALRTLVPLFNIWIPQGELIYLSNSPLVLFAAVLSIGLMWRSMTQSLQSKLPVILLMGGLTALFLSAMILDVQRATICAVFLSLAVLMVWSFVKEPRRVLIPAIIIFTLALVLYPFLSGAMEAMAHKTALVGLNARVSEARAVFETTMREPVALFMGYGWGATFSSPAVAGLEVNYTHSLLTTMFLKGGLILAFLCVMVLLAAFYQIFLIFQRDRTMALALFWSVCIPALLYASHKSLDFGLILLMLGVWSTPVQALPKTPFSDRTIES